MVNNILGAGVITDLKDLTVFNGILYSDKGEDSKPVTSFRNLPHPAHLRVRQIAKADYRLGYPCSQRLHEEESSSDRSHVGIDLHMPVLLQPMSLLLE